MGELFTSKLICFRITIVADYTVDISYGSNMGSDRRRAYKTFKKFFSSKLVSYSEGRDFPGQNVHSMLAPYLSLGQISVKLMFHYLINKSTERQCSLLKNKLIALYVN